MIRKDKITSDIEQVEGSKWTIKIGTVVNGFTDSRKLVIDTQNFGELATGKFATDLVSLLESLYHNEMFKTALNNNSLSNTGNLRRLFSILEEESVLEDTNLSSKLREFREIYFCNTFTPSGRRILKTNI